MNLMNLLTSEWDDNLLAACVMGLREKLPELAAASEVAGSVSSYFQEKYAFSKECLVLNASGDNPNSLIGCGAAESGTAVISLGTSDTFFSASGDNPIDTHDVGHVFGNPAGGFMSLICFRNGSLSREDVLKSYNVDWSQAEELMKKVMPASIAQPILPFLVDEIYPAVEATTQVADFAKWDVGTALVALIESQFINLRLQSKFHLPDVKLIRLTGGASRNTAIAQIIADIFQAKVECIQSSNSAALGAAMRAANSLGGISWGSLVSSFSGASQSFEPNTTHAAIYEKKSQDFVALLESTKLQSV